MRLDYSIDKRWETKEKQQACHYILAYLVENPDAGDTLDGIVEWWLLNQRIRFETQSVLRALARLVADGLIVAQKGPDSRIVYKANRTIENIQVILSEMRSSSDG